MILWLFLRAIKLRKAVFHFNYPIYFFQRVEVKKKLLNNLHSIIEYYCESEKQITENFWNLTYVEGFYLPIEIAGGLKMITNNSPSRSLILTILLGLVGVGVGIFSGFLAGANPKLLVLAVVAIGTVCYFFAKFEQAVLGLLILRSSLDVFSDQQVPAAFAIGLNILALLYVTVSLLTGRTIRTDKFWWFFAGWVMLQGIWPILCVLGGLGLGAFTLLDNIREWTRLFSWLMVYLLVLQLQGRLHPEKMISLLFISLIPPVSLGVMQQVSSLLFHTGEARIHGTFAHANNFVLYLLLFIALTWWKLRWAKQHWYWLLLLGLLTNLYVATGAVYGLVMIAVFVLTAILPKLKLSNAIAGIILLMAFAGLFFSTDYGIERVNQILQTPLLNSDIDISRAIVLSTSDFNSFNWRISQWYYLLQSWQNSPLLGYGLGTSNGFPNYYGLSPYPIPAHNDYVRALVEGGILGLFTFLSFLCIQGLHLIKLFWQAPRQSDQRDLCWTLFAVLIATSLGMLTDNVWSGTAFYFYWWTTLAIVGWNWNQLHSLEEVLVDQQNTKR